MSVVAPVTGTGGADSSRERLLAAAADVFMERGYDRAGVQEIARRAGLTTGAIYGNFSGKAELLLEAINLLAAGHLEQLLARPDRASEGADLLRVVGRGLAAGDAAGKRLLLLEALVAARRDGEVADLMRHRLHQQGERLRSVIEAARANGDIADDVDTEALVRFSSALALGFLFFEALDMPHPDDEPWARLVDRVVDALADQST